MDSGNAQELNGPNHTEIQQNQAKRELSDPNENYYNGTLSSTGKYRGMDTRDRRIVLDSRRHQHSDKMDLYLEYEAGKLQSIGPTNGAKCIARAMGGIRKS